MMVRSVRLEMVVHGFETVADVWALTRAQGRQAAPLTLSDAEIRRPRLQRRIPAAINMVEAARVRKVRPINGKLVVRVELALECVVGGPDVARGALQHIHTVRGTLSVAGGGNSGDGYESLPVIDRGTVKVAIHALKRRRTVVIWICREDDIPQPVN